MSEFLVVRIQESLRNSAPGRIEQACNEMWANDYVFQSMTTAPGGRGDFLYHTLLFKKVYR